MKAKVDGIGERLGRAFRVVAPGYKAFDQWSRQGTGMVWVHKKGQGGPGENKDIG